MGHARREASRVAEEHAQLAGELARRGMNPSQRLGYDTERWHILMGQMQSWRMQGRDTSQIQLEIDKVNLQIQQDITDQKKQQNDEAKKAQDAAHKQQETQEKIRDVEKEKQRIILQTDAETQRNEEIYPSLAQLARAGHSVHAWGHRAFVRTPEGEMAHEILTLQRDQLRRRVGGDIGRADWDAGEIGRLKGILSASGFQPRDDKLEAINLHLSNLNGQIAQLRSGNNLNVKLNDVDG